MCLFCFDGHRVPTLHHFLHWRELTASPDSTHGWLSKKRQPQKKQTVKCTWTAVLTPKPTTTERIKTPDWRDSNRKIQHHDQWRTKSKWCLCVFTKWSRNPFISHEATVASVVFAQLTSSLSDGRFEHLLHILVTVQWNLRGNYR